MSQRTAIVAIALAAAFAARGAPAQDHVLDLISIADARDTALVRFIDEQLAVMGQSDPQARRAARERIGRRAWRAALPSLLREIRPRRNRPHAVSVLLTLDWIGGHEAETIARRVLLDERYRRSERIAAALLLGRLGTEGAARAIAAAARQPMAKPLKIAVAIAAARLRDKRLANAVRRIAPNAQRANELAAAATLARHFSGIDVTGAVEQLGRSNDPVSRRVACLIAAELDDSATGRMLRRCLELENNDPWTAAYALIGIGSRPGGQLEPLIRRRLSSAELEVRRHAAIALGWFETKTALDALRAAATSRANASSPTVREAIGRSLARRGHAALATTFLHELGHPQLRIAGLLMLEHARDAVQRIDGLLARETDETVASVALSLRLTLTGVPLPPDHAVRSGRAAVRRVLESHPWAELDRYRDEPGAPAWHWARRVLEHERERSSMEAVRMARLDATTLELLHLDKLLDVPERRVVGSLGGTTPRLGATRERRRANELSFVEKDLKLWLVERGYFRR